MVVDSSAICAILLDEPEAPQFVKLIGREGVRLLSTANYLETGIIADRDSNPEKRKQLDELIDALSIELTSVTPEQARIARDAYRRYGRGNHPAGLNFGDCFAYALAKLTGEPLLFKGEDFAKTDIRSAQG